MSDISMIDIEMNNNKIEVSFKTIFRDREIILGLKN